MKESYQREKSSRRRGKRSVGSYRPQRRRELHELKITNLRLHLTNEFVRQTMSLGG